MDKWVEVDHDFIMYTFLQWYNDNVGKYKGESCTPSDRYNYHSVDSEKHGCIAHIDFYMGRKYFIDRVLYEYWNDSQGVGTMRSYDLSK